jgi:probable rRNA maturation factor
MMLRLRVMADVVDLVIEDDRWAALDMEVLAEQAARAALEVAEVSPEFELCIMGCSDARITELNTEFREKPTATNVLSWPAFELLSETIGGRPAAPPQAESLGDIAIAYETCEREAAENGITMQAHVKHLIVHGCLHLLGYDHETDEDAELMENLEVKALASMGVEDPY